jgi:N-acyl-D-amino-acid deacylase
MTSTTWLHLRRPSALASGQLQRTWRGAWIALVLVANLPAYSAAPWDLVIRHGRVVDGTGNPAFHADVAVRRGRIAALGRVPGSGAIEIDAQGLVVAPGFIDVHTHAENVLELPLAENFVRMGVTTVVAGNCGSSEPDIGRFLRAVDQTKVSLNVATLVGHGTVRRRAMGGSFDRPPTAAELSQMRALVAQAMRQGALGLSTGLIYPPGSFAQTEEIIELARMAAAYDGIYASHMRNEGRQILQALDELFRIARTAGIRAQVSHIKLSGPAAWGRATEVLAALERARAEGLDVTQDQYLYTAAATGLSQLIPDKWLEGGRFNEHLANPEAKAAMIAEMKARLQQRGYDSYAFTVIAQCKANPALEGLNVVQAALKARGSDSLDDQIELILELQRRGGASGIFHGIHEDDLRTFLLHPNTMIASDSSVRRLGEGVPHPRGYGNTARLLARYVRELKLLRLEDAIRRLTSLPATTFRLEDRGLLRPGAWADLVVFDPARIQDQAQFGDPHRYATGFAAVIVNGVVVVRNDVHTGARPGHALHHSVRSGTARAP